MRTRECICVIHGRHLHTQVCKSLVCRRHISAVEMTALMHLGPPPSWKHAVSVENKRMRLITAASGHGLPHKAPPLRLRESEHGETNTGNLHRCTCCSLRQIIFMALWGRVFVAFGEIENGRLKNYPNIFLFIFFFRHV